MVSVLTRVDVGIGGEEDAKPCLVIDGHAGGVVAAHLQAVGDLESARQGVEHVGWGRVDEAGHHLKRDLRGR